MKILVINGSPKGNYSVTLQTCEYLRILHPEHEFTVFNASTKIKSLEKDFSQCIKLFNECELIIFSYPVYTFTVPSQLHRFIELIKENNVDLTGKFATQITTSKHFYDVTAHEFIRENCFDLGINFINGLSADMNDLLTENGQKQADAFFNYILWCIENKHFEKPKRTKHIFEPVLADMPECISTATDGNIIVLTDAKKDDLSLNAMISRFCAVSKRKTRVINISDFNMSGGCLGCLKCAATGQCVYKDGFSEILRNTLQKADAIVYAFTIRDHSMGSLFKMYDDRQFCNGHRSETAGMPVGYIVSGSLETEDNLRMIIKGKCEVGGNFLCSIATDEYDTDTAIDKLSDTLEYALANSYVQPSNFLGVGGMKIFRDLVYSMRGIMQADNKFYKEHKLYDFPQKQRLMSTAMFAVGALLSSEKIIAKMGNRMNEGMLMPYKKVIDKAVKVMSK